MFSSSDGMLRTLWREQGQLIRRWLLVLAVLTAAGVGVWRYSNMPATLRVAVGPAGSAREIALKSLAKAFAEGRKPIRLKIVTVPDSAAAARLLDDDQVDLALVRSDEAKIGDARSFAIVDRRVVVLAMRAEPNAVPKTKRAASKAKDADAEDELEPVKPAQLAGKRIVVAVDPLGSNHALVARLLAHSGLSGAAVTLTELPADQVAPALASQQADVAAVVVEPTAAATRALIADIAAAFSGAVTLSAPPSPEGLAAIHRDLAVVALAPGVFGGMQPLPEQKLTTVAITDELVGDSDLSESIGAQLSKALQEARGRLLAQRATFGIESPPADTPRRYTPHAGIAASDKSTSFLETYSEQIWLGLFALGLIGSSLAGLAGWLGLSRPDPTNTLPKQVQALIGDLDAANTVEDVERLRHKLREIAGQGLRQAFAGEGSGVDPAHPTNWYPLADALALRRRDEIAGKRGVC